MAKYRYRSLGFSGRGEGRLNYAADGLDFKFLCTVEGMTGDWRVWSPSPSRSEIASKDYLGPFNTRDDAVDAFVEHTQDPFIRFGEVARERCGEQCQYASRYLNPENPNYLGDGLRIQGDVNRYHDLLIHRDDADEFVRRMREFRIANGIGWSGE